LASTKTWYTALPCGAMVVLKKVKWQPVRTKSAGIK
jgi:hypothetical protein